MKKNLLFLFCLLLYFTSCYTRYLRIGEAQGQYPPCEDARIIHKLGKVHENLIKNYIKIPLCDSLCDRAGLLDAMNLNDIAPTVYDLKEMLGEPLHIYTNNRGYKAFFYPSSGRLNESGNCNIDQLFIIFYRSNDSLWLDYDAMFYDAFTKNCNGDNMPSFLKYWNNPSLPKESKFGDKFAPVDFTYDKRDGGRYFISLENKIYPNGVEKKE
jgi:hypothetical protein